MGTTLDHSVIGMRCWLYATTAGGNLQSVFAHGSISRVWQPGINEADCAIRKIDPITGLLHAEGVPSPKCLCGYYAYHEFDWARARAQSPLRLLGIIRGWGRIQCHPDGWRSQYAEVLAMVTDYHEGRGRYIGYDVETHREVSKQTVDAHVRQIASRYSVPVVPASAFPDIALEFGKPVPVRHRPTTKPYDQEEA